MTGVQTCALPISSLHIIPIQGPGSSLLMLAPWLLPTYAVSAQATGSPISGTARDFTTSKSYTITAEDFTTKLYNVSVTVNQPPVAAAQNIGLAINTPKPITLAATDVNGDVLTYVIVTSPVNGTLSGTPPNVTYTPTDRKSVV